MERRSYVWFRMARAGNNTSDRPDYFRSKKITGTRKSLGQAISGFRDGSKKATESVKKEIGEIEKTLKDSVAPEEKAVN